MGAEKTNSKLMTPLFYGNSFNRDGHKMRAIFVREVSNGNTTYRLWQCAGKADVEYPRAENDRYLLYVELNGYLVPLRMTDFALVYQCGFHPMIERRYGNKDIRSRYFDELRTKGDAAISAAIESESLEIESCGNGSACQADYIQKHFEGHTEAYLASKQNNGITFPDFYGAAVLNELDICEKLSAIYQASQKEKEAVRASRLAEEESAFCDEQNKKAEQQVSEAIQIIQNGGTLENQKVTFYRSQSEYSTYSVVNYLMRMYQVDIPLRTQGWVNEKLISVTIEERNQLNVRYYRSKKGKVSEKFFDCMYDLIRTVNERNQKTQGEFA